MAASIAVDDLELALRLADLTNRTTLPRFTARDARMLTKPDHTAVTAPA